MARYSGFGICNRCKEDMPSTPMAYSCLRCFDHRLCPVCAAKGLYCENDTHQWSKYSMTRGLIGPALGEAGTVLRPGGKSFPTIFRTPRNNPDIRPDMVFEDDHRFINRSDNREILIYTDGSCVRHGQDDAQGGCCIIYRSNAFSESNEATHIGTINFALEGKGPTGITHQHTVARAQLRAVIAALQCQDWSRDNNRAWRSVVIANNSQYVTTSAIDPQLLEQWEGNSWKAANGIDVQNVDLWELLLMEVRRLQENGVNVSFWRIPRAENMRAYDYAKIAAEKDTPRETFHKILAKGPKSIEYEAFESPS